MTYLDVLEMSNYLLTNVMLYLFISALHLGFRPSTEHAPIGWSDESNISL